MPRMAFRFMLALLITGAIGGCSVMKGGSSTALPSSAFFQSDSSELTKLHAVAVSQDAQTKPVIPVRLVRRLTMSVG